MSDQGVIVICVVLACAAVARLVKDLPHGKHGALTGVADDDHARGGEG